MVNRSLRPGLGRDAQGRLLEKVAIELILNHVLGGGRGWRAWHIAKSQMR